MGNVGFFSIIVLHSIGFPRHRHSGDDPLSQSAGEDGLVGGVDWGASKAISAYTALAGSNVCIVKAGS